MIFTEFLDMIDEEHGLAAKHAIISQSGLPNSGAYTSVGDYDVHELVRLVVATSEHMLLNKRVTGEQGPGWLLRMNWFDVDVPAE